MERGIFDSIEKSGYKNPSKTIEFSSFIKKFTQKSEEQSFEGRE